MIGKRFGALTVIGRRKNTKKGNARRWCVCECGRKETVRATHLAEGKVDKCQRCADRGFVVRENVKLKHTPRPARNSAT